MNEPIEQPAKAAPATLPEHIPRSEPAVSGAESLLQEAYSKVHASELDVALDLLIVCFGMP